MKTYDPRLYGNPACPTGEHELPYGEEGGCSCPWLIVQSDTPQMHITTWSRRELDVLIREVDRGMFDPADYPRRAGSRFLSDFVSQLVGVAQRNVAEAMMMLMGRAQIEQIAWDPATQSLSLGVSSPSGDGVDWYVMQFTAGGNRQRPATTGHDPQLLWKLSFAAPAAEETSGRVDYGAGARARLDALAEQIDNLILDPSRGHSGAGFFFDEDSAAALPPDTSGDTQ